MVSRKEYYFLAVVLIALTAFVFFINVAYAATLTCSVGSSCSGTALMYLQNDSGGYNNAHAQHVNNKSFSRYNNSLCCTSNAALGTACGTTFLRLSNLTNAHAQVENYSGENANYTNNACIDFGGAECTNAQGSCPSGYTCLVSIGSSETNASNLTNAHVGPCSEYSTKICCRIVDAPSSPAAAAGGGGGGVASPKGISTVEELIRVIPRELSIYLTAGINETRKVSITNLRNSLLDLEIGILGLSDIIKTEDRILLRGNEERVLTLDMGAINKGLLTGKLIIIAGSYRKEIPIVLNVKSENFLFDAGLSISDKQRIITAGEKLLVQINLLQVGPKEKVDVTVNYAIKDFSGDVYLEDSETFSVLEEKDLIKSFPTNNLLPGEYIVGIEVIYPGAFANSSALFTVEEKKVAKSSRIVTFLIILAFVGFIVVIWALIKRRGAIANTERD